MIISEKTDSSSTIVRIEPSDSWADGGLKEVWDYRELLYFLIWRDVKVRYKQTVIGAAWAVIQPFMTMVAFTLVFDNLAGIPSEGAPYPIFSYVALLPWTYFSRALTQSITSVVGNAHLITKVYFPRLLLPFSAAIGGLIDFALGFVILLVMLVWYRMIPGFWGVLMLPAFVLLTVLTAVSVSLWLSVINVRYRDVGQATPFLINLWLFASPVVYPASMVSEKWRALLGLNPMVGVIEGFRWALLGTAMPSMGLLLGSTVAVLVLFITGLIFFKRMESTFADLV